MQIKKLVVAAVIPFALLGCPDKAAETKPAAAAAGKPAASAATPANAAGTAAPAKSGGW